MGTLDGRAVERYGRLEASDRQGGNETRDEHDEQQAERDEEKRPGGQLVSTVVDAFSETVFPAKQGLVCSGHSRPTRVDTHRQPPLTLFGIRERRPN